MRQTLIFIIRVYRFTFGQLFARVCRFAPSCSCYAIEAIHVHGAFKGSLLTIWRILRCNPFCPGGWDPVPPRSYFSKSSSDRPIPYREGRYE